MCSLCKNHYDRNTQHIMSRAHKIKLFKLFREHKKNNYLLYFPERNLTGLKN